MPVDTFATVILKSEGQLFVLKSVSQFNEYTKQKSIKVFVIIIISERDGEDG
jgi:hypothetical protein